MGHAIRRVYFKLIWIKMKTFYAPRKLHDKRLLCVQYHTQENSTTQHKVLICCVHQVVEEQNRHNQKPYVNHKMDENHIIFHKEIDCQ